MSQHTWPAYGDIVEEDFIKEIVPELWKKLTEFLDTLDSNLDDLAMFLSDVDNGNFCAQDGDDIKESWEEIKKEFEKKTGLELEIFSYTPEGGPTRADEIPEGCNFSVYGVYELSPAGKKYKNKIERKTWTNFG